MDNLTLQSREGDVILASVNAGGVVEFHIPTLPKGSPFTLSPDSALTLMEWLSRFA